MNGPSLNMDFSSHSAKNFMFFTKVEFLLVENNVCMICTNFSTHNQTASFILHYEHAIPSGELKGIFQ